MRVRNAVCKNTLPSGCCAVKRWHVGEIFKWTLHTSITVDTIHLLDTLIEPTFNEDGSFHHMKIRYALNNSKETVWP